MLDPLAARFGNINVESVLWSDYDDGAVYGDYTMNGAIPETVRSFEPGIGRAAWSSGSPQLAEYYHMNHLGTTRFITDANLAQQESSVYTAFGERVSGSLSGPEDRYGYVGAWGYQETVDEQTGGAVFPYLHVGHRYYDPSSGRFLQRDPIGIRGGLTVYAYVRNGPTIRIDPDGLAQFDVGACVGYCGGRLGGCIAGARGKPGKVGKCEADYKACETCCGNADIDSEMGNDRGPPPYGPPPATFGPWPSGGSHWRAIGILLLCFLSLWVKRVQAVSRVSK